MKPVKYTRYIAVAFRVAVTILLFWFIVTFVQVLTFQTAYLFVGEDTDEWEDIFKGLQWREHRSSKEVLPDGTIHLVYTAEHSRLRPGYNEQQIFDVNGSLIWEGLDRDKPFEYLQWAERPSRSFYGNQLLYMQQIGPELSRLLDIPVNSNLRTEEVWRYDVERQIFTGYGREGDVLGYIGAGGFAERLSEAVGLGDFRLFKLCEGTGINPVFLWQTDNRIYEINFETRQVRIIFESPTGKIGVLRSNNWNMKRTDEPAGNVEYRPMIFCRTEDNMYYLIMRNPEQTVVVEAFKNENPDSYSLDSTATNKGVFLLCHKNSFFPPPGISEKEKERYRKEYRQKPEPRCLEFYSVGGSGDIELVSSFDWIRPAIDESMWQARIDSYERYRKMTSSVSPPAYDLLWRFLEDDMLRLAKRRFGIIRELVWITDENQADGSFINLFSGALMVLFAFWHGWSRRTGWPRFIFWLVFVGLFNLAGLLTYLALNHTVVIKCPVCGRRRGLETENCIRCGAQLPVPEKRELDLILST